MAIVQLNNQGIHYKDSGGDGPPVVLMHGFLMDLLMFEPQVNALQSDFRIIRFDARGFGATAWDGEPFDLYDTVADCVALMDHLGIEQAIIGGMSQGGYAALRMALRYPQRVRGLVLMSTRASVDEPEVVEGYREMRDTWKAVGPVDPLVEGLAEAIIGPREDPRIAPHWETWLPRWRTRTGDQIFHAMNNLLERDEISDRLGEIEVPALVIHGNEDSGVPPHLGVHLYTALPQARGLVIVPGAAHVANLTHGHAINPALRDFLEAYA